MKIPFLFLVLLLPFLTYGQRTQEERPSYCDELPVSYEKAAFARQSGNGNGRSPLPRFGTSPTVEYKVQVAILKFTDPKDFPFHPTLVARYRPCEEVWVVESRESFVDRRKAEQLQKELERLGYRGSYITQLVAYHAPTNEK